MKNNAVFGKSMENISLSQQEEEKSISHLNQVIILRSFSQKIY